MVAEVGIKMECQDCGKPCMEGLEFISRIEKLKDRFMKKVNKGENDECWIWIGAVCNDGYGNFFHNGKVEGAHRISYMLFNGNIPNGNVIMHICNNPSCVNPNHLKLGTHKENIEQRDKEYRSANVRGEMNPNSKLTLEIVKEIRWRYNNSKTLTCNQLSKDYGVEKSVIIRIVSNKSWIDKNYKPTLKSGHEGENCHYSKLTWEIVNEIRLLYNKYGKTMLYLANKYCVSEGAIHCIIHNKTWFDDNYNSKIIVQKRNNEIKEKYSKGKVRMIDLAKEFNINRHEISHIIRNDK